MIFRDYLMAFLLSPEVSTRDPIISPRALADGRGLILRAITKTPCYSLFITYSISLFQRVWRLKNVSKTEERLNFCVTSRNLFTSDVIK